MAGVATVAVTVFLLLKPHQKLFSKIMENYKILNPDKVSLWASELSGSVLSSLKLASGLGNKHCSLRADREVARSW